MGRPSTDPNKALFRRAVKLRKAGKIYSEIAAEIGKSTSFVAFALRPVGLGAVCRMTYKIPAHNKLDKDGTLLPKMIAMRTKDGMTNKEIARAIRSSEAYVQQHLAPLGLTRPKKRSRTERCIDPFTSKKKRARARARLERMRDRRNRWNCRLYKDRWPVCYTGCWFRRYCEAYRGNR